MPSNNSKYSQEMREQTVRHILETGKSATSMAEELGIDVNTVCRWVRDYRRKHGINDWCTGPFHHHKNGPAKTAKPLCLSTT